MTSRSLNHSDELSLHALGFGGPGLPFVADDEGGGVKLAGDAAVNQIDRPAAVPFALFQKI